MAPSFVLSIAASLFCFTALARAENSVTGDICPPGKRHARASIRHIEGGGIGYNQGYTTLETFLAPDPSRWNALPFFDLRGHVFDNGKLAANAGIGLRGILGSRVYGFNAYYDYRNTHKIHYNQLGVGLETLGTLFDFRINGYLPFGKKISSPYAPTFDRFSGHHMILRPKYQFALKGIDAEMGFHFGKSHSFDFYAAAGPYYYIGEIGPSTWGGKGRINCTYQNFLTLEISDSYDTTFRNNIQGQLTLTIPFGSRSRVKKQRKRTTCKTATLLTSRMVQPVGRQEIIPVDTRRHDTLAIDPATGEPYFFVFVNNMSNSSGTYESPYHSFAQAQNNSSPNQIIYVFPGDGTTTGMDAGIALQANQQLLGSGVSHLIQTTLGAVSIPAQTSSSPTITNTDIDTDGNAITLAHNNVISGFNITSALNDAIYGTDSKSLEVTSCTFENTTTYPIEAAFVGDASISITQNQFVDNVNGIFLTLNGTSSVVCSNNTFTGQTSVSNVPIEISADSNVFSAVITHNTFSNNTTGSIRFGFNQVIDAQLTVTNNTLANNGTGSQSTLGSNFVIISTGTTENCSLALNHNSFTGNTSNSLYMHTSGQFTSLNVTASANTLTNNGGSGIVLATPVDALTLLVTDNLITNGGDNGIAVISPGLTTTGTIAINNNTITDIANASNGIAINQDFTTLNLTIASNTINNCAGTGILSYAPNGIDSLTLNISNNTISNCDNLSSNAAAGLDIEQYNTLAGTFINNISNDNVGQGVFIGSSFPSPSVCLEMTGNQSNGDYLLSAGTGIFHLAPCNVDMVNTGTLSTIGAVGLVESCPGAVLCPP